jgi:hypothetical protein
MSSGIEYGLGALLLVARCRARSDSVRNFDFFEHELAPRFKRHEGS